MKSSQLELSNALFIHTGLQLKCFTHMTITNKIVHENENAFHVDLTTKNPAI